MPKKSSSKLDDTSQVAQYMSDLDHPMKATIEELRDLIKSIHPDIKERIKWNAPSYNYKDIDILTFGPPMRKKDEVMLVFHHPYIVQIDSELLEGYHKDRRLMIFSQKESLRKKGIGLKAILTELLEKI